VAVNDTAALEDNVSDLIDVLSNDTGLTDTPIRIVITQQPEHGTARIVANPFSGRPIVAYTPNTAYTGPDTFRYLIRDGDDSRSNTATVTITVSDTTPVAVNDAARGDSRLPVPIRVLSNDQGLVDAPVTIEITDGPSHGTATVNATTAGSVAFIEYGSDVGYGGSDQLKYRLLDADGDVSNTAVVSITVENFQPAAADDSVVTEDGRAISIAVLGNDAGLGNRPVSLSIVRQPEHGVVEIVSSSDPSRLPTITYTPDDGYEGTDRFRYRVSDGDGDLSNPGNVTVDVRDSVPEAVNDTANGDARELTAIDVLANDAGLADPPFTLEIVAQPLNGTAELSTLVIGGNQTRPGISYASDVGFAGTDFVSYRITDADGDRSGIATLTLTVADLKPAALDDTTRAQPDLGIPQGQTVSGLDTAIDVLNNDTGRGNRPNLIKIVEQPAHGTVRIDSAEETGLGRPGVRYQSEPDYVGPERFRYRVRDADGDWSNVATVAFDVVNQLTAIADGNPFPLATSRDTPLTVTVLANDAGLADGPIAVEILSEVNGEAVVNSDNTITFTPTSGFVGRFPSPSCQPPLCIASGGGGFRYKLTDAGGQASEAPVFIDVFPATVTDSGGSSSADPAWIALLALGGALRCCRARQQATLRDRW
jgi:hypothetical protein